MKLRQLFGFVLLLVGAVVVYAMTTSAYAADDDISRYPKMLRYEEDYRYLADPSKRTDVWDPIKYIPLSEDGSVYLSLGGEWRERYEYMSGGLIPRPTDNALMHRFLLSADLHIGPNVRTFVQLGLHGVTGRDSGTILTDSNGVDVQQAFVDLATDPSAIGQFTLRGGRQEMTYGSQRFVSIREGPNIRRSFDGVRGMYRSENFDLDLFATRPVALRRGGWDDPWDTSQSFWGAYAVNRFTPEFNVDLYYLGYDNDRGVYQAGRGNDERHTVGSRFWGKIDAFDYNFEGAYQFGRFSNLDVRAYGVSGDVGWTFSSFLFSPRIGVKGNIESGDDNPFDGKIGTLAPLFPNHAYFSEAAVGAPMNSMDVQPHIAFELAPRLTLTLGYDMFWRQSRSDAVYTAGLTPIPRSTEIGRRVGDLFTSHIRWQVDRHVEVNFDYTHFTPSRPFKLVGGREYHFGMASIAYRF